MATKNVRASAPPPEEAQLTGIDLSKCDLGYLLESYGRLYKIHASGKRDGSEFRHPHPKDLSTKETAVRAISNWMLVHGNSDDAAECDRCKGPMDMSLMEDGTIPERCIYCGDGEVIYDEAGSSPANEKPKKPEKAKPPADDPEEDDADEEAPPESAKTPKRATKIATKKVRKTKKTIAKTETPPAPKVEKPKFEKAKEPKVEKSKGPKKDLVKVERAKAEKPEVVSPEAKSLLDGIEKVRGSLTKTTQDVYAEMWSAGRWFADVQKSKAWQKHPSAFGTWKDFVEGCFGVLVNVKRVDELVAFHKANKELPRLDSGVMKLPALPRAAPPKPRGEREGGAEVETDLKHDPNYVSFAGTFRRKQRVPFLTSKGKPAKKTSDAPFIVVKSENGVEMKVTIGTNTKGELVGNVLFSRE